MVVDLGEWGHGPAPVLGKPLQGDELKKYLEEAKHKIKVFKESAWGGV